MRFPKIIRHRKAEVTIYGKKPAYPFYRVAYRVDGKRRMKTFALYSEACKEADTLVKDLAIGSPVAALSPAQARDAIAAFERLRSVRTPTGHRLSLLGAVSELADALGKLNGRSVAEAIDGYLTNVAVVKGVEIKDAVEEFLELRRPLTEAKPGKRAQLSKNYHYMVSLWLRTFAKTFKGACVCDLTKDHLNRYLEAHKKHSPKTRNHLRGAIKMFLNWCMKRDYLSKAHRLFESDAMVTEIADTEDIDYYRPQELQAMLHCASENSAFKELLPFIALGGLAGLRLQETMRLTWADVWRVPGHVEVTASKSKTRARRLVELVPALAAWIEPYRELSGPIFVKARDTFHATMNSLRESIKIPVRRNGLRHGYCTYHFALYSNENLTAAQAGNSPSVVHAHYKGLATKAEAEKWFAVMPARPANVVILTQRAKA